MALKRSALWSLVAVATVGVVLTAAWRTSDLGRASADYDLQFAAAKREGVPTEYADLHRLTPPVPTDDNAAPLYDQAFASFKASGGFAKLRPDDLLKTIPAGTASSEDLTRLRTVLRRQATALAQAKAGAGKPGFSYDRAWEQGTALTFPQYADAKGIARTLVLRAMLAKEPQKAADDLRTAARMRRDYGGEPTMIGALMGNAMEADVERGVRFLGRRGGAWTRAMGPVLDALGPIPALKQTLTGEAVWGMHFDEEIAKVGWQAFSTMEGDGSTPPIMRLMSVPAVRRASTARIIAYWRKVWKGLPEDPTDYQTARAALAIPPTQGPSYALLQIFLPVFEGFTAVNARSDADRRLSRAALALWSGGKPTLAKDPFGTGPLKLKRDGKGWTLYSLGPDGNDDGGKPKEGNAEKGYDLVVRSGPG